MTLILLNDGGRTIIGNTDTGVLHSRSASALFSARKMFGTPKHFALAAAGSAAAGLVVEITSLAAFLSGIEAPRMPLDGAHLLGAGAPLYLVGAALVWFVPSVGPEADLRKGPAPRAFWALTLGLLARAWAGQIASPTEPFYAAMALGGSFVELAAVGLLAVPALRPAAALTPQKPSGTESSPSGS